MTYAKETSVSPEKTRVEIEKTLKRYGASQFVSGWDEDRALIGFSLKGRQIRLVLELPTVEQATKTGKGLTRHRKEAVERARTQMHAQRWRALLLVIKAKLEAVESGITTLENEFLAHMVLPDGSTVGNWVAPQIKAAYENGTMPRMLGAGS